MDDDVIVVDKPAGLVVHPAAGHESGTLVNGLLARGWFRAEEVSDPNDAEGHLRPGIVHRLDKGTSGVMVVARNATSREALKQQFQIHSIEREYEALALGVTAAQTISTFHGRHPTDRMKFTSRLADGKRAVTHVQVLAHYGAKARAISHVVCRLETGRTHQIRVHLAEVAKTPILGDPVYGNAPSDLGLRRLGDGLGRQALHARLLGFVHPKTGESLTFTSEPPADFQAIVTELAAESPKIAAPESAKSRAPRRG
jgi:23S rRNA pseudouridine1911/1915/1917 synthase